MRKLALLVAGVALFMAAPASARDLYVTPVILGSASDTTNLTNPAYPCTLGTALRVARPGDVIHLRGGPASGYVAATGDSVWNYTATGVGAVTSYSIPRTTNSGTIAAGITIQGNPDKPSTVVLNGGLPGLGSARHFIWYRYFRMNGDFQLGTNNAATAGVRASRLQVTGYFSMVNHNNSKIDSCAAYPRWAVTGGMRDNWFSFGAAGTCPSQDGGVSVAAYSYRDTVNACSLYVRASSAAGLCGSSTATYLGVFKGSNGASPAFTQSIITNNRFLIVKRVASTGQGPRPVYFLGIDSLTFRGNRWAIIDSSGTTGAHWDLRYREHVRNIKTYNDSFYFSGSGSYALLSSDGEITSKSEQGRNKWDGCVFSFDTPEGATQGPSGLEFQWGANADTFINNVVVSRAGGRNGGLRVEFTANTHPATEDTTGLKAGNILIRHNTFASYAWNGPSDDHAAVTITGGGAGGVHVTQNIFAQRRSPASTRQYPVLFELSGITGGAVVDTNLYWDLDQASATQGNGNEIHYQISAGSGQTHPDDVSSTWYVAGYDRNSNYGDPRWVVTGSSASVNAFDATLSSQAPTSAALFGPDGYVGARTQASFFRYVAPSVTPGGNGLTSDTTATNPNRAWRLSEANLQLSAGQTAILAPGRYDIAGSDTIYPRFVPPNEASRIRFVGTIGNAQACSLSGIEITRRHVTVNSVKVRGEGRIRLTSEPADSLIWSSTSRHAEFDSLINVFMGNPNSVSYGQLRLNGAQGCVVTACTLYSARPGEVIAFGSSQGAYDLGATPLVANYPGLTGDANNNPPRFKRRCFNNTFTGNYVKIMNAEGGADKIRLFQGSYANTITNNKFVVDFAPSDGGDTFTVGTALRIQYANNAGAPNLGNPASHGNQGGRNYFSGNRWTMNASGGATMFGQWMAMRLGDNSCHQRFYNDTVYAVSETDASTIGMELATSATAFDVNLPFNRDNVANTWSTCRYVLSGPIQFTEMMDGARLDSSVIVVSGADSGLVLAAANGVAMTGSASIMQNTIAARMRVVRHMGGTISSAIIKNNIFYDSLAYRPEDTTSAHLAEGGPGGVAAWNASSGIAADNIQTNLYYVGHTYANGDSAIKAIPDGSYNSIGGPFASPWQIGGRDVLSVYADPVLHTTALTPSFNQGIVLPSPAFGAVYGTIGKAGAGGPVNGPGIIDHIQTYTATNRSEDITIPYTFTGGATDRYLAIFISTCHATNGVAASPIADVFYAGDQLFNLQTATSNVEGQTPVRQTLYATGMNVAVPASGNIVIQMRTTFSATPTNIVVHVVGLTGASFPGYLDTEKTGTGEVGGFTLAGVSPVTYLGLLGSSLRSSGAVPALQFGGAGILQKLADATAGFGEGAVRGTLWQGDDSGSWSVSTSASAQACQAIGFSFSHN